MTGRYEFHEERKSFNLLFNDDLDNTKLIFPQYSFNWGQREPDSDYKASDYQGLFLWRSD